MKDTSSDIEESEGEDGVIVNSDDEVVAYYFNNNAKKFYKKPFKGKLKNNTFKKSASISNLFVQNNKDEISSEKKSEEKPVCDSGYDCNYCNGITIWERIAC